MVSPGRAPASAAESWAAVATLTLRPVGLGLGVGEGLGDGLLDTDGDGLGDGLLDTDGDGDGLGGGDGPPPLHGDPLTRQFIGSPMPLVLKPKVCDPPAGTVAL